MAFQRTKFNTFYHLIKNTAKNSHPEVSAIAENFILEERLTEEREDSYEVYTAFSVDVNEWFARHRGYISDKIEIKPDTPETFTNNNIPNLLMNIDIDQYLVRLEDISWPSDIQGIDVNQMIDYLQDFLKNTGNPDTRFIIDKFLADWNRERDFRPIFSGFWGETKDIFTDVNDNEIFIDDWSNQLRDRFGLGHFDPDNGEPIPVLLLRYRVRDVLNAYSANAKIAAIPTVLDSDCGPFFCPTPIDGWNEGQTVDLSPGDENNYFFNCEIIHRFIEYQQSYLYRAGWITNPPGKTCYEARKIHFEFLKDDFKNFRELEIL